jgi:uncharacterized protein YceK
MRPQYLLVAVLAFAPAGCGTIKNLSIEPGSQSNVPAHCVPFGGFDQAVTDANMLAFGFNPGGMLGGIAVLAIDAPLSLVGDVVTLPYILAVNRAKKKAEETKCDSDNQPEDPSGVKWGRTKRNLQGAPLKSQDPNGYVKGVNPATEPIPAGPNGGIVDRPALQASDPNRNR